MVFLFMYMHTNILPACSKLLSENYMKVVWIHAISNIKVVWIHKISPRQAKLQETAKCGMGRL